MELRIKRVIFERKYAAGYIYRRELVDDSDYGGDGNLEMVMCYTPNGDYIGDAKTARFLCKEKGLTHLQKINENHCVCSIGFNEKEQKWYGWSHRAIFGFGVGSEVKKGDCAYKPRNEEDEIESARLFWEEDGNNNLTVEKGEEGLLMVRWDTKPNSVSGVSWEYDPDNFGKGEWTAKTLDDAKQMAIDFAEGVS